MTVDDRLDLAVSSARDDDGDVAGFQVAADEVGVVALVGQQHAGLGTGLRHHRGITLDVRGLPTGQGDGDRQAQPVASQMDLGREATARTAQTLAFRAPFLSAPAAC